jgi:hypothetical protein
MGQHLIITSDKFIKSDIHIIRYTGDPLQKKWLLKSYPNVLLRMVDNTPKEEVETIKVKFCKVESELSKGDFLIVGNYFVTVMSEKALLETFRLFKYQLKELGISQDNA